MKKIPLTQGFFALVDDEDFECLNKWKWFVFRRPKNIVGLPTAVRNKLVGKNKRRLVYMHREILKAKKGNIVDHKNHKTLDNRKCNLRFCTQSQNLMNARKRRGKYSSRYKGVSYNKNRNRWQSCIHKSKRKIYVGSFKDEKTAALAYDKIAKILFGKFALPNF